MCDDIGDQQSRTDNAYLTSVASAAHGEATTHYLRDMVGPQVSWNWLCSNFALLCHVFGNAAPIEKLVPAGSLAANCGGAAGGEATEGDILAFH